MLDTMQMRFKYIVKHYIFLYFLSYDVGEQINRATSSMLQLLLGMLIHRRLVRKISGPVASAFAETREAFNCIPHLSEGVQRRSRMDAASTENKRSAR